MRKLLFLLIALSLFSCLKDKSTNNGYADVQYTLAAGVSSSNRVHITGILHNNSDYEATYLRYILSYKIDNIPQAETHTFYPPGSLDGHSSYSVSGLYVASWGIDYERVRSLEIAVIWN